MTEQIHLVLIILTPANFLQEKFIALAEKKPKKVKMLEK